ncbi:MAG: amidohydrolase family protein [Dehalococcoidia bacterium]|nr:amidohydrolase family protein [Dehalococcoidia bacterium]MDP7083947.1 amidohydrolase family protein [Dehalococcoidia bacterium]MDP7199831.1 amidohydrolase family protein [Dehalococcoidia bacterium]MDP7509424.1 amidohydrolase family protein [Dehalococcoidia bacterium]HJN87529.1 amidohydrolase family protein [Dehalococcoidia bacterium]
MPKIICWMMQIFTPETLNGFYGYPKLNPVGLSYQKIFKVDFKPRPLEDTVRELREANMLVAVPALDNDVLYGTSTPASWVRDLVAEYPDVFIGFSGADPNKGYDAVKDLERDVKEYDFRALYLQPMESGVPIDDRRHYPLYTRACDLDIPVFVACSVHYNNRVPLDVQSPYRVDQVAVDFPDLKIVLRHALFPWIWEIAAVMMRHPNMYMEISSFRHKYIHPEWIRYIDSMFPDRTVYGLGHPFSTPKQNIEEFGEVPLKPETKNKILYETSPKLLRFES